MDKDTLTGMLRLIEAALEITDESDLGKLCQAKSHLMRAWEALAGKRRKERNNGEHAE